MKKVFASCWLALTLTLTLAWSTSNALAQTLVISAVNIISMGNGDTRRSVDVVIREGRISEIVAAGNHSPEATAQVVDAAGGWLIPGLAEMHAHIPSKSSGEQRARDILTLYLANGVTTARGMLGENWHLDLRGGLTQQRHWIGPRLITSGPSFNGRSVDSPEQAEEKVRAQHTAGFDFLKLHPGLKAAEFEAIANTANALGIPFAGHISADVGLQATLRQRQATIDHLDGYAAAMVPAGAPQYGEEPGLFGLNLVQSIDMRLTAPLAMATRQAGVWNVPTQSLLENLAGNVPVAELLQRPGMEFVSDKTREAWVSAVEDVRSQVPEADRLKFLDVRRSLIRTLQDAGAGLLLGSDAPQIMNVSGFSIHQELAFMVAADLTPLQALQTGTIQVAEFLGRQRSGDIEPGFDAHLVLLGANPLQDINATQNIRGVIRAGNWHDRATLDTWLEDLRQRKL